MLESEKILKRNISALIDFSNKINSNLDVDFTLRNLLLTLFAKFFITKGAILLYNSKNLLENRFSKGISETFSEEISKLNENENEIENLENLYQKYNLKYIFEIKHSENRLGFLILGNRINKEQLSNDDFDFIQSILNIAATSIQNSLMFEKITSINQQLDSKINQLNSLFDLAKEFSGVFDVKLAAKKFIYTVLGQFLISKYSIISCGSSYEIIESKFDENTIKQICEENRDILQNPNVSSITHSNLKKNGIEIAIPMKMKDEIKGIVFLGKRANGMEFSKSDIEFISSVASLATISMENGRLFNEFLEKKKIEKDLDLARTIQQNLIPSNLPKLNNFEISAINKPAKKVSGDYFDVIKLVGNRILIVIADVSGKGMQAALLMANLQAFIKSLARKSDFKIAESTNILNDLVSENTINGSFITMFWGILDDTNKTFEFVNAGHNPPLLIRNGNIEKLKVGGMILGVMETLVPYSSRIVQLNSNDFLYLFTDGITEAMDENLREFSDEKFEQIASNFNGNTSSQAVEKILDEVSIHTKNVEQSDDITLMIIKTN